jgi:hypothetical protein
MKSPSLLYHLPLRNFTAQFSSPLFRFSFLADRIFLPRRDTPWTMKRALLPSTGFLCNGAQAHFVWQAIKLRLVA